MTRMEPVILPESVRRVIDATTKAAYPEEGCGYLLGQAGDRRFERAVPTRNVHPGPRTSRYLVDALEFMELEERLDAEGKAILGIYHSHPAGGAVPSETDLASALPNLYYLVHDAADGVLGSIRAWRLNADGDAFDEVSLLEE